MIMNLYIVFLLIALSVLIVVLVVGLTIYAINKEKKIMTEGIEVDSIISRIEETYNEYNDFKRSYRAYVKYVGNDNMEHEALLNVSNNFPYGRKIRIKYLPPEYDFAIFVSQELEECEKK